MKHEMDRYLARCLKNWAACHPPREETRAKLLQQAAAQSLLIKRARSQHYYDVTITEPAWVQKLGTALALLYLSRNAVNSIVR